MRYLKTILSITCKNKLAIYILVLFISTKLSFSQNTPYPYDINYYNFIHYNKNIIKHFGDSANSNIFYGNLNNLIKTGEGNINIIHIGGSHIQADIYTSQMRERLQKIYPGLNAGRGFIFPYNIAKTNNPSNYESTYTGDWLSCKNTLRKQKCNLGLSGYSISTTDSLASIKVFTKGKYGKYDFITAKVFYNADSTNYSINIADTNNIDTIIYYFDEKYIEIRLKNYSDTLELIVQKNDTLSINKFSLYGIYLENNDAGITYSAIGVNGASIPSFLRCNNLYSQMNLINPDMVILSLGTNDAYGKNFNKEIFRKNLDSLIINILETNSKIFVLLTVPNDDYLYRKYPNKNTALQQSVILDLARKYNTGVWDLYEIMGGFNSSQIWYDYNLMKPDRIHFTREGYILKGNLFFNAFLRSYDNYLEKE